MLCCKTCLHSKMLAPGVPASLGNAWEAAGAIWGADLALGRPQARLGGASCGRLSGIENYFWCTLFWSRRGICYWGSGIVRGAGIGCSSRGDVFARKFFVVTSDLKFRPTGLSCKTFVTHVVRLQLHALAYNLGNFLRTLATPEPIKDWSLTSLKEEADQDRRKGRPTRPLCCLPDGAAVRRPRLSCGKVGKA